MYLFAIRLIINLRTYLLFYLCILLIDFIFIQFFTYLLIYLFS